MSEQRKNNFIIQGSILAIAGIVSRIIGMLFRIPMLAIIGEDELSRGGMTLKNMATGEQQFLTIEEVIKAVKE